MMFMKKFFSIIFLVFSISVSAQIEKIITTPPNPPRLVNDYSNELSADQVQALERKLVDYDRSTSTQIVIVVVPTLDGNSLEDAALSILRNWGVGGKQNNNGIVILAALNDRKITIQTGYGMEGVVPDVTAKAIIDNSIVPNFKARNYYRGFDQAIDDIMRAAEGKYQAPAGYGKTGKAAKGLGGLVFIIIIILFVIFSGRGGGRGGGGMVSRRGYRDFGAGWILGSLLSGGGGGGWSGGGGGGGGGFGGFGGGGGGGGGASGSW